MTISKPFKEKIRMYHVHYIHIQVTDVTGCSAGKRSAQRFHVCTDSDWHVQITSYKHDICQSCLQTRYCFPGLEQCVQTRNGFSSFHLFHIFAVLTNATRYLLGQKKGHSASSFSESFSTLLARTLIILTHSFFWGCCHSLFAKKVAKNSGPLVVYFFKWAF